MEKKDHSKIFIILGFIKLPKVHLGCMLIIQRNREAGLYLQAVAISIDEKQNILQECSDFRLEIT